MTLDPLREAADRTLWIDTHEHLLEPSTRRRGAGAHRLQPCTDFALLFHHYAGDDLRSAGMTASERDRLYAPDAPVAEKWTVLRPWWERCRHTGYLRAVAETLRTLYAVEPSRLDAAACERISARMATTGAQPDFYRRTLDAAGVLTAQVNSLETGLFMDSGEPDVLLQDMSLLPLSTHLDLRAIEGAAGFRPTDLDAMHRAIDACFRAFGPRAVAAKSQAAYSRRLDYLPVHASVAAPLFRRFAREETLAPDERKALEDHLMRHCLQTAAEHGLPVKLHCGYYAGTSSMPLSRVRDNAADVSALLRDFPDTRFVLMHIGYPYQDEYVALAKHYPNANVDLCWAWIVNPEATVRFVREFLLAAPANKLLCFGGDYSAVENVVGHAVVARQGLALALRSLVTDGWLAEGEALALVPRLMAGNAQALFALDDAGRLARGRG